MKLIIAGSRTITDFTLLDEFMAQTALLPSLIEEVVSGTARGVDTLGEMWASKHNIPIKKFPANWTKWGKSAGYRRNEQMSLYADAAVIIMTPDSKGSTHMKNLMEKVNKPVYLKIV